MRVATHAVLASFLAPENHCNFLELRTTPRANASTGMTRRSYLETVLDCLDDWNAVYEPGRGKARLIVSIDYRMGEEDIRECVELAHDLKRQGRSIVGLDICGDPSVSRHNESRPFFSGV